MGWSDDAFDRHGLSGSLDVPERGSVITALGGFEIDSHAAVCTDPFPEFGQPDVRVQSGIGTELQRYIRIKVFVDVVVDDFNTFAEYDRLELGNVVPATWVRVTGADDGSGGSSHG